MTTLGEAETPMQIGESVALSLFSTSPGQCPLEPHEKKNGFTSKEKDKKDVVELRASMESGKSTRKWIQKGDDSFEFGDNFDATKKPKPEYDEEPIRIDNTTFPLAIAAHHIIPGKASLPKSTLRKYIWASEDTIESDIGYDVDGAENGIWLPTHMAVSTVMKDVILVSENGVVINDDNAQSVSNPLSWRQLSNRTKKKLEGAEAMNPDTFAELFVRRYTQQAMKVLNCQFHDAHSKYNEWVRGRLDRIDTHISTKIVLCEICEKTKKSNGKYPPPYALVHKLNQVSHLLSNFLKGRPRKTWKEIYTSAHAVSAYTHPVTHDLYGDEPPAE